jgi:hypothetical protein
VALIRRPVASHTTDAGLGLLLTGQSGAGGGAGGACTTGTAAEGFLDGWWARDECAGWAVVMPGDGFGCVCGCDVVKAPQTGVAAASIAASITQCIVEDELMRDGVADVRMGMSSRENVRARRANFEAALLH